MARGLCTLGLLAIAACEEHGPMEVSGTGAEGLARVTPATERRLPYPVVHTWGLANRYMRHLWVRSPGEYTLVMNEALPSPHLTLRHTVDAGQTWVREVSFSTQWPAVADGILDGPDRLLLVTASAAVGISTDVRFHQLDFNRATGRWQETFSQVILPVTAPEPGSRATLAMDSAGVLWMSMRVGAAPNWHLEVRHSVDGGATWNEVPFRFGSTDEEQKATRIVAYGPNGSGRIALVYRDSSPNGTRGFWWASRGDALGLDAPWDMPAQPLAMFDPGMGEDPHNSHWSLVADDVGGIHLTYQHWDITYTHFEPGVGWSAPAPVGIGGQQSNLAIDASGALVLAAASSSGAVLVDADLGGGWVGAAPLSTRHAVPVRLSVPERIDGELPVVWTSPVVGELAELWFNLASP